MCLSLAHAQHFSADQSRLLLLSADAHITDHFWLTGAERTFNFWPFLFFLGCRRAGRAATAGRKCLEPVNNNNWKFKIDRQVFIVFVAGCTQIETHFRKIRKHWLTILWWQLIFVRDCAATWSFAALRCVCARQIRSKTRMESKQTASILCC